MSEVIIKNCRAKDIYKALDAQGLTYEYVSGDSDSTVVIKMDYSQMTSDLSVAIKNLAFAIARNGGKQSDHVEIIIADKLKALTEAIIKEAKR